MHYAYALQRAERDRDADPVFARACKLGLAIGCTNYGAALWLMHREPQPACARRLFTRACDASEPFGCGMLGRMLADAADTPARREEARRHFDRVCSNMGGMTCRMYAHHLVSGDLGDYDPATVKALMLRACNTGDDDACGTEDPEKTFH